MSTLQKVLIGSVVAALVLGGVAWAAVEASSSTSATAASTRVAGPNQLGPLQARLRVGGLRRFGAAGFGCRLAHADAVIVYDGATKDVRIDHGTVQAVGATSVTVSEADGSTVTIPVDAQTRVRRDGQAATLSSLQKGDVLFALRVGGGAAKGVRAFDQDRCSGTAQPAPAASSLLG